MYPTMYFALLGYLFVIILAYIRYEMGL